MQIFQPKFNDNFRKLDKGKAKYSSSIRSEYIEYMIRSGHLKHNNTDKHDL